MQVKFGHFSLRPTDLEATARFYTDVLGLADGYRPPFGFPGKWLYLGTVPILHLIGDRTLTATSGDFIDRKALAGVEHGSGVVDHIAFCGERSRLAEFRAHLDARQVEYAERMVPILEVPQIFIEDPDGVTIEIMFDQ
ncbi:MAG TPA: VOC family protein [Dongiaceae bacterium]|jgi:catechol 2,3-dioxygenase-like lactoylglutathione lyase family enzyme|nr:VOC family protein [Dongiaceae bacterium]